MAEKPPQNISNEKGDFYIWRWLGFPGHSTFTEIMALSALLCPGDARTRQVLAGATIIFSGCFKNYHYYHICEHFLVPMRSENVRQWKPHLLFALQSHLLRQNRHQEKEISHSSTSQWYNCLSHTSESGRYMRNTSAAQEFECFRQDVPPNTKVRITVLDWII